MRTLVEYGIANAAAATALAIVALAVGLVIRRPAVRNALWLLVLVRLVLPPVWTIPLPVPTTEPALEIPFVAAATVEPIQATTHTITTHDLVCQPGGDANDVATVGPMAELLIANPAAAAVVPPEPVPVRRGSTYAVLAGVWLAGTIFVLLIAVRRIVQFRRALRDARPAPATIQLQANELARALGLRRCPEILLVPGRVWPSLWMPGLFARQAKLILPAGLLPLLDPGQRAAVLAHELAHLRRGDPWVRWLELVVVGLYWWHPLLGWFRRKLREAEEECCDLWVVAALDGRRDYATALVETAAYLGDSGPVPALASGAGPVRNLQRRVTMIMRATWPARLTRLGLAAVLGVGGLGLAFGPALAQERREERKDPPAKEPERPRERLKEKEKDRPDGPPRERGVGDRADVDKARADVEKARRMAQEAMERLRAAEEALARAEGRPFPPRDGDRGPGDRGPRDRGPGDRGPGDRGPGDRGAGDRRPELPPVPPMPPGFPRRPGAEGGGELRELQQQMEELRRALEQMRQELRRERGDGGDRKDPGPREGRPKEEPKRPLGGR